MNGSIILPGALVELCVAPKEEIRYYLQWPYLDLREPGSPMLVATNGKNLLAAPVVVEGELVSCSLPLEAIAYARRYPTPRLTFSGEMCGTDEAMFRIPDNDSKYPLWRKLVDGAPNGPGDIGIGASLLDMLHRALGENRYNGVTLTVSRKKDGSIDPAGVVRVRSTSGENADAIALLMPMRI